MAQRKRYSLPLRNGVVVDVQDAYGLWGSLRSLQRVFPQHFEALYSVIMERQELGNIDSESRNYLVESGYIENGEVDPLVANVIQSAYQETPDGPTLVLPFRIENDNDRKIIEAADRRLGFNLRKQLPPEGGPDEPGWSR